MSIDVKNSDDSSLAKRQSPSGDGAPADTGYVDPRLLTQLNLTVEEDCRLRVAHRRLTLITTAAVISTVLALSALVGVLGLMEPVTWHVATTHDGRTYPLVALKEPHLSDNKVAEWTARALRETFTYTYLDYQDHFADMGARYFTTASLLDVERAMVAADIIQAVRDRKLISHAVITSTPILVNYKERLNGDTQRWEYALEGIVTYLNAATNETTHGEFRTDFITWRVVVSRVPFEEAPGGIRITQIRQHVKNSRMS